MIRHIVFWRLNGATPALRKEQAVEIKQALEALNGRIAGLIFLEVGLDFSASEVSSDIALYSEFKDRAALDFYQSHPAHLDVKPFVAARASERRVVDYEAGSDALAP